MSPRPQDWNASSTSIGDGSVIVGPKRPFIEQAGLQFNDTPPFLQSLT